MSFAATDGSAGSKKVEQETFIECDRLTQEDQASHDKALVEQYNIARINGIDAVLKIHDVDVLIVPFEASKATRFAAMAGKVIPTHSPEADFN